MAAILSADCALREALDSFLAFSTAIGGAKIGEKRHNQVKHQCFSGADDPDNGFTALDEGDQ